ncbi:MAG: hypothetical protein ACE5KM_06830 [Planctomycetaceae bacterium]
MSKITYAAMSLIVAVPGAVLSYLLVAAMLNHFGDMAGMIQTLVCAILAISALMAFMPVGIVIFVKDDKAEKQKSDEDEDSEEAADDVEAAEEEEQTADEAAAELPDLEAAGVDDAEESVMIEHSSEELEEVAEDIYEADEEEGEKK